MVITGCRVEKYRDHIYKHVCYRSIKVALLSAATDGDSTLLINCP